jgi:cysteine synthase A
VLDAKSEPIGAVDTILETVGRTPVVRLSHLVGAGEAAVYVKLEQFNPSGTIADRLAGACLDRAFADGSVRPGKTLVAPTSADLGIALATACAVRGHALVLSVPDDVTREQRALLRATCSKVVFTPAREGDTGAQRAVDQVIHSTPGAVLLRPLSTVQAAEIHAETTAVEIIEAADAAGITLDAFVAEVGRGTVAGLSRTLRSRYPSAWSVPVQVHEEAADEPELSTGGSTFRVSPREAWAARTRLAREEGILAGLRSGAVLCAALHTARQMGAGKSVFAVLADTGERDFSLARTLE